MILPNSKKSPELHLRASTTCLQFISTKASQVSRSINHLIEASTTSASPSRIGISTCFQSTEDKQNYHKLSLMHIPYPKPPCYPKKVALESFQRISCGGFPVSSSCNSLLFTTWLSRFMTFFQSYSIYLPLSTTCLGVPILSTHMYSFPFRHCQILQAIIANLSTKCFSRLIIIANTTLDSPFTTRITAPDETTTQLPSRLGY